MKNGTLWLDTDGRGIQAHGGSILQHNGIFYWYGENKDTDTHNRSVDFVGFSCYKSRAPEEECGRLLQFLYENSVQPELWQDVISCWYPQAKQAERLQEGRRVV